MDTSVKSVKRSKPKNIVPAPEEVKSRILAINEALLSNDTFQFNILMQQLSNWTVAKRRQAFRGVLKFLLTGSNINRHAPSREFAAGFNIPHYSMDSYNWQRKMLNTFIRKIKSMNSNNRFMPEKVLTITKLPNSLYRLDHNDLVYLLDSNILQLSTSFSLATFTDNIHSDVMLSTRNGFRFAKAFKLFYERLDMDINNFSYDIRLYTDIMNTLKNIDMLMRVSIRDRTPDKFTDLDKSNLNKAIISLGNISLALLEDTQQKMSTWLGNVDAISEKIKALNFGVIILSKEDRIKNFNYLREETLSRTGMYSDILRRCSSEPSPVSVIQEQGCIL